MYRILRRAGLTKVEPKKRPRSSYIRFQADLPNEMWQADFTHWRLADGSDVEILCWIDDHSRTAISVTAHRRVTGPIVVDVFTNALHIHGVPASTLTDNGMVFTTRLSGGRGGRNGFETLLDSLGIIQKNSRPNHPTTCGKIERFHQTLKRWLTAHPTPATIDELQALCDRFVDAYNHRRPPPLTRRQNPRRHLPRSTESRPRRQPPAPSPRPSRPGQPRQRHPARRRRAASHRARPPPPRHPHHHAHQRPQRPRHQRHHRRNPPPTDHRPHPPLPRHRPTTRRTTTTLRTTKNDKLPNPERRFGSFRCLATSTARPRQDSNPLDGRQGPSRPVPPGALRSRSGHTSRTGVLAVRTAQSGPVGPRLVPTDLCRRRIHTHHPPRRYCSSTGAARSARSARPSGARGARPGAPGRSGTLEGPTWRRRRPRGATTGPGGRSRWGAEVSPLASLGHGGPEGPLRHPLGVSRARDGHGAARAAGLVVAAGALAGQGQGRRPRARARALGPGWPSAVASAQAGRD